MRDRHNTTGRLYTRKPQERAWESMPAEMREVLRNAIFDYEVVKLAKLCRENPVEKVIDYFLKHDAFEARQSIMKEWGAQAYDYIDAQRPRRRRDWLDTPARRRPALTR